jgi:hypothetical protein
MFLENVLRKYIYFIFIINSYKKSAMMTKKVGASWKVYRYRCLTVIPWLGNGHSGHWALGSHLCFKKDGR